MTVGALIKQLSKHNPRSTVYVDVSQVGSRCTLHPRLVTLEIPPKGRKYVKILT